MYIDRYIDTYIHICKGHGAGVAELHLRREAARDGAEAPREFTKGGLAKGGLAIHVLSLCLCC